MYNNKKVAVVMPAYNAEKTLLQTYNEVKSHNIVDLIIVVDDASNDKTVEVAKRLDKTIVHTHEKNMGYGANQKSCYKIALENMADIVIMVHPDYQYTPKLIPAMVSIIESKLYDCVLGSRILGGDSMKNGMPWWKYFSNRFLTFIENLFLGIKLSEYHTGYRAFSRELLEKIDLSQNSNDFIFDNEMLAQVVWNQYKIAEISCPTKYFSEASSINFSRSVKYGFGCLLTGLIFRLSKSKIVKSKLFK